jgi:hypothetical protein
MPTSLENKKSISDNFVYVTNDCQQINCENFSLAIIFAGGKIKITQINLGAKKNTEI